MTVFKAGLFSKKEFWPTPVSSTLSNVESKSVSIKIFEYSVKASWLFVNPKSFSVVVNWASVEVFDLAVIGVVFSENTLTL